MYNRPNNSDDEPILATAVVSIPTSCTVGRLALVGEMCGDARGDCPDAVEVGVSPFVVGRYPECELHLTNPCISGRHAVLTRSNWAASQLPEAASPAGHHNTTNGNGDAAAAAAPYVRGFDAVLADTSTNGCYHNNKRVGRGNTVVLADGDLVQFVTAAATHEHAKYNLTYRFTYPPAPVAPRATAADAARERMMQQQQSPAGAAAIAAPLETAPAGASQYDVAQLNQSDIESDDEIGEGSDVLALGGTLSRPITRKVSSVKRRDVSTSYDLDLSNPLGSGAFATVYRATHRRTGRVVAVKQINKKRLALQHREKVLGNGDAAAEGNEELEAVIRKRVEKETVRQQREVDILLSARHPHVVRCYGVYETDDYLWFVLSFAAGGELFSMLRTLGSSPEALVRRVVAQLVAAVQYLHSIGVVHRDIKLENLLLYRPIGPMPPNARSIEFQQWLDGVHVQVSDFGLSRVLNSDTSLMSTMCGTPVYAAPEVTNVRLRIDGPKEGYTPAVDLYSVGVVAYALLTGRPPYPYAVDKDGRRMKDKVDYWQAIKWPAGGPGTAAAPSFEARDCIRQLLAPDPRNRLPAADCLAHPWMTGASLAKRARPSGGGEESAQDGHHH